MLSDTRKGSCCKRTAAAPKNRWSTLEPAPAPADAGSDPNFDNAPVSSKASSNVAASKASSNVVSRNPVTSVGDKSGIESESPTALTCTSGFHNMFIMVAPPPPPPAEHAPRPLPADSPPLARRESTLLRREMLSQSSELRLPALDTAATFRFFSVLWPTTVTRTKDTTNNPMPIAGHNGSVVVLTSAVAEPSLSSSSAPLSVPLLRSTSSVDGVIDTCGGSDDTVFGMCVTRRVGRVDVDRGVVFGEPILFSLWGPAVGVTRAAQPHMPSFHKHAPPPCFGAQVYLSSG